MSSCFPQISLTLAMRALMLQPDGDQIMVTNYLPQLTPISYPSPYLLELQVVNTQLR